MPQVQRIDPIVLPCALPEKTDTKEAKKTE